MTPWPPPSPKTASRMPRGRVRGEERLGDVDELARRANLVDACGARMRRRPREGLRRGSRVRASRLEAGPAAAGREQNDGLAGRDRLGTGGREQPPLAELLEVEAITRVPSCAAKSRHELGGLEVRLVPERDEAGEAEPVVGGEQRELERQVAALRDQPDRSRRKRAPADVELGLRRRTRRGSSARAGPRRPRECDRRPPAPGRVLRRPSRRARP